VSEAEAVVGCGLLGDHRLEKTPGSARQVTLISQEFIQQTAHFLGKDTLDPALLRRNLVISGINLHLVRYQQLQIGDVILEASALCHPCARMEQNLGAGGFAAMYGHGGLCAKVVVGGVVTLGAEVKVIAVEQ